MRYQHYNPNPIRTGAGDCVIRAICKAEDKDWGTIYMDLSVEGMALGELPNSNMVWDSYLSMCVDAQTVQICIKIFVYNYIYKCIDETLQMMYNYTRKQHMKVR